MNPNTGSFGANLGGISALKQAMQKRGLDASILDQVSAAAPGQQVAPSAVPQTNPATGNVGQEAVTQATGLPQEGQLGQPEPQFRSAEMMTALKALQNTVDTENKISKAVLGLK